jgi:hypothetical protein
MASGFKKTSYGSYYILTPSGDKVYIDKSDDRKGMWTSGGQLYSRLREAKADVIQRIGSGQGFSSGGLTTKKYVNPVKVVDNRKNI